MLPAQSGKLYNIYKSIMSNMQVVTVLCIQHIVAENKQNDLINGLQNGGGQKKEEGKKRTNRKT